MVYLATNVLNFINFLELSHNAILSSNPIDLQINIILLEYKIECDSITIKMWFYPPVNGFSDE